MKRNLFTTLFTLALVAALSSSAFAGNGTFTVVSDSTVQGKALRPGTYHAVWDDDGDVRISGERGPVIKVQGKIVEREKRADKTSILKQNDASGDSKVLEIRFAGKKTVLVFGETKVAQAE